MGVHLQMFHVCFRSNSKGQPITNVLGMKMVSGALLKWTEMGTILEVGNWEIGNWEKEIGAYVVLGVHNSKQLIVICKNSAFDPIFCKPFYSTIIAIICI